MTPGAYNIPAMVRGDTFAARTIATATIDGDPLAITSARLQIRNKRDGSVIYEWNTADGNASITGAGSNAVLIDQVDPDVTADWPVGIHAFDLEVVTVSFGTITLLAGNFPLVADTTRTTS